VVSPTAALHAVSLAVSEEKHATSEATHAMEDVRITSEEQVHGEQRLSLATALSGCAEEVFAKYVEETKAEDSTVRFGGNNNADVFAKVLTKAEEYVEETKSGGEDSTGRFGGNNHVVVLAKYMETFEERAARREAEIAGLKEDLQVLNDETSGPLGAHET